VRILVLSQTYTPDREGGAEKIARLAVEGLARAHEVRVLALAGSDTPTVHGVQRLAFRQTPLPGPGGLGKKPGWRKGLWHAANAVGGVGRRALGDVVTRFAPDVIHAHNSTAFLPQLGEVARAQGVPIVWHAHDYGLICARTTLYRDNRTCAGACGSCRVLTSRWRQALGGAVSDVIAVSGFLRDRLSREGVLSRARWHVLHNPIVQVPAARKRNKGLFTFGFLGALTPEKGIGDLVREFARLPRGHARLVVGGQGQAQFLASLKRAGQGSEIDWLGQVEAEQVYGQADAMVVPSRWDEPFGLVAGETMARGLPLIAARRGGLSEQVAGYAGGRLFQPGTGGELYAALVDELDRGPRRVSAQSGLSPQVFLAEVERILSRAATRRLGAA